MGFLDNVFRKSVGSEIETKKRGFVNLGGGNFGFGNGYDRGSKWDDFEYAQDRGMDLVVWVYRCVDAIANSQAGVTINTHKKGDPLNSFVEMDNVFNILNSWSNPYENSFNWRYRLTAQLLLSTKGAFIEVSRTAGGKIMHAYLLDPGQVEVVRHPTKFVDHYKVNRGTHMEEVAKDDIIWVMIKPRPGDPYHQMTPITSAGVAIDTDYLARKFNANFLKNDGRPGMLIAINGDADQDTTAEILDQFRGGPAAAGMPVVIEADGMDVIDMQGKPRDAQWEEAIASAKDTILAAFGVPESVLGNASGRCLRASEKVHLANGSIKRAEELVGQTVELMQTWKGTNQKVNARVEYAAKEPIYKLTTFSGRTIETNGEHPLYMATSVARGKFKRDFYAHAWTPMHAISLNYKRHDAVGDGTYTEVAIPLHFNDEDGPDFNFDDAFEDGKNLDVVPDYIFKASAETKRSFLSGVYSTHGRVSQHTAFDVVVPSSQYASDLQIILQRLGINAYVNTKKLTRVVSIGGKVNIVNFLAQVEIVGDNEAKAVAVFERLSTDTTREINFHRSDDLPEGFIWDRIADVELIGVDQTVAITINKGDNSYLSSFLEHNTYSNAETENEGFWVGTMKPHCQAISRGLEPLTGSITDDITLKFNFNEIDVLERVERKRLDTVKQDWASGALTQNEYLEAIGRPRVKDPLADVYMLPNGLPIGDPDNVKAYWDAMRLLSEIQAPKQQNMLGASPFSSNGAIGDGIVGGRNDMITGQTAAVGINSGQTINQQAARTLRSATHNNTTPAAVNPNAVTAVSDRVSQLINKSDEVETIIEVKQLDMSDPHKNVRHRMHGLLEGCLESWSSRQISVVSERVNHVKVRKGTRHWDGETKVDRVLDTGYIVEQDKWVTDLKANIAPSIRKTLRGRAFDIATELKENGHVRPKPGSGALETLLGEDYSDQIKAIADCAVDYVAESAKSQTELVAKHISILDNDSRSIEEIKSTLDSETFDRDRWIIALAKTATTAALEDLSDLLYFNVSEKAYKIWRTAGDEHFRADHISLNGVKLSVKDSFTAGIEQLRYPCDGYSDANSVCSCWIFYGVDS